MLTRATSSGTTVTDRIAARTRAGRPRKLLVVNGQTSQFDVLEPVLEGGRYDVVVVESSARAYAQVRELRPDLIVLFMPLDDPASFQVLSMLKLDPDTRRIPIVTYTAEPGDTSSTVDETDDPDEADEPSAPVFPRAVARRMN